MPNQSDLLANAAVVNQNVDPKVPHPGPSTDSFANMHREHSNDPLAAKAATNVLGDDLSGKEGAAVMAVEDYSDDDTNENNNRVAARLQVDKDAIALRLARDRPVSFHRAGSPLNVGDLSNGGMGGDLGEAAGQQDGDTVDNAQQAAAWNTQATAAAAASTPKARKAAAAAAPVGSAALAGSVLLGDDAPAASPAATGPAPAWPAPVQGQ